jgi:hypothetical protein
MLYWFIDGSERSIGAAEEGFLPSAADRVRIRPVLLEFPELRHLGLPNGLIE